MAFSVLALLDVSKVFFHEGELPQYNNHEAVKHHYECLEQHSEGLVVHWYRVSSEEGSDTKFQ